MANFNYYGFNLQLEYSLDTIAQRDAIPVDAGYREIGTRCYVQATNTIYQLVGGIANANWIIVSTGGMTPYTPSIPNNWPIVPTNFNQALDYLALRSNGPDFTFTSGAPQKGNTYGDWLQLMNVINSQPVERPRITFTTNFTIPAGTWNLRNGTIRSYTPATGQITVTIPDTAIIDNLLSIEYGLHVDCTPSTPHDTFTFTGLPMGVPAVLVIGLGAALGNTGSQPLITANNGQYVVIALEGSSDQFIPALTAPIVNGLAGSIIIGSAILAGAGGGFKDNWVSGTGQLNYQLGVDVNYPLPSIPSWVGPILNTFYSAKAPNVGYSPSIPSDWSPAPTQVASALDQLATKGKYLLMLASLNPSGVWYPLEFVGPTSGSSSSPSPTGYGTGVGFCRVPRTGKLSTFKFTNATPPASDCTNIQVYIAPNGNLSLLGYSGITLSILAGEYISSAVSIIDPTAFDVNEDDIIVLYNADPFFGYTPDALTITAELNFS